ncbi:thiol-disulfide isomerase/thioredoxin [Agrobacterium vitis]|nr:thiol-disulfide isomerase/thioredoxin [Agrobacterium vitis]MBE1436398.1 thiol-disulfide isomerase/thioredoxin [Agrobacterium vitis]
MTLSRRHFLGGAAGFGLFSHQAAAKSQNNQDYPPVFETTRYQYTLLQPVLPLTPTTLTDRKGKPATLAPAPGRVMLINIWATWCAACNTEMPLLEKLHHELGHKLSIAAVSTDRISHERVDDWLETRAIRSLPVFLDPEAKLASSAPASSAPLRADKMPTTYLITADGLITGYMPGEADWLSPEGRRLLAYYGVR